MKAARILASMALTGALACGSAEEAPPPTPAAPAATPEAQPEPAPPAPPPAPAPPAPAAAKQEAPKTVAEAGGDAARGAPLYATYCASCHGPKGDGDGPVAASLDPRPAKHSDAAYMKTLSDEHLFKVIKFGGPAVGKSPLMAPWGGTLNDAQIWDLVAFTRTLAK